LGRSTPRQDRRGRRLPGRDRRVVTQPRVAVGTERHEGDRHGRYALAAARDPRCRCARSASASCRNPHELGESQMMRGSGTQQARRPV
jgi:hypothetical protein